MPSVGWFHLLLQFSAVQTLLVNFFLAGRISVMLEHLSDAMITEVMGSLDLLCFELLGIEGFWERPIHVENFVAARRDCDRPVTVVRTRKQYRERLESYISN